MVELIGPSLGLDRNHCDAQVGQPIDGGDDFPHVTPEPGNLPHVRGGQISVAQHPFSLAGTADGSWNPFGWISPAPRRCRGRRVRQRFLDSTEYQPHGHPMAVLQDAFGNVHSGSGSNRDQTPSLSATWSRSPNWFSVVWRSLETRKSGEHPFVVALPGRLVVQPSASSSVILILGRQASSSSSCGTESPAI